jgi:hypothetical protein
MPCKTQTQKHIYNVQFWKVDPDAGTEYAKRVGTIISYSVHDEKVEAATAADAKRIVKRFMGANLPDVAYDSVSARRW